MKLTAQDLYDFGIVDSIIKEYNQDDISKEAKQIKKEIKSILEEMKDKTAEQIVEERYEKFRKIGYFKQIDN